MNKRMLLPAALACGLCLLVLSGCEREDPASCRTAQAEMGAVENRVEDTGAVAYRDPYSVIPVVNGKIVSCGFEEGDRVEEGQELYVIDSTDLEDQITQARLSLESAELAYAQSVDACADLAVKSSAAGTVTAVYCHVGDYVAAGTRIADVTDSVNLTLTVPFAPADAAALAPGSAAVITFASYSDSVSGTVKRIYEGTTALNGGREGVYVEIGFQNPGVLTSGTVASASVGGAACMESGAVGFGTEQSIFATQSGQVLTLPIDVGSAVAVDEVVMTIDNSALTNARANAALARETAEISLAQLEAKRADYIILSPVAGTVISRSAKVGDYAAAATPMAALALDSSMCVEVEIDEIYIDRVWPGQEAEVAFTTDSGEQRAYTASVRRVDDTGITSGGVTDYTVELTLDATEGLKAGMNVAVSIVTERRESCLRIPTSALDGTTVRVLRDGKAEETTVTPGLSGGGYTEILEGLAEGDAVILN